MGHKYQPIPHRGETHDKAWGYELWIVNHELYCGKLLVFEKGKKFSMHYHLIKEESWYVAVAFKVAPKSTTFRTLTRKSLSSKTFPFISLVAL